MRRLRAFAVALAALASACATALDAPSGSSEPPVTRAALYAVLDAYLAALEAQDPDAVAWAAGARVTENNVELPRGEGLWNTISELGGYEVRFADVEAGQVGVFGSLFERTDLERPFTLRLKVEDGAVSEAELLVFRYEDAAVPFPRAIFPAKPAFAEVPPPEARMSREELIAVADGYFETLELNDGRLFTRFDPGCNRFENGFQTTNNPDQELTRMMALGCEEQFRLGAYRYDDRVRARRYPLVDAERGLVLAAGFIDHSGRLARVTLTDGSEVDSPFLRPHTLHFMELFKIRDGAIEQIESNFFTAPYYMPSPWDEPGD